MISIQVFILFVIHTITISECVILKNRFENINFGLEMKIPLAPTVISAKFSQKLDHFKPTDVRTWEQVCNCWFTKRHY